ncbi:MAG: hypothetical protein QG641_717, partial [Candidatus Poribacteria bacterium]|nr:hypothetical protein [Candidatus Poribacteria bacterium]
CVIRDYSFDFFVILVTFVSLCLITEKLVLMTAFNVSPNILTFRLSKNGDAKVSIQKPSFLPFPTLPTYSVFFTYGR